MCCGSSKFSSESSCLNEGRDVCGEWWLPLVRGVGHCLTPQLELREVLDVSIPVYMVKEDLNVGGVESQGWNLWIHDCSVKAKLLIIPYMCSIMESELAVSGSTTLSQC